ncbi:thymidine kinase [Tessaracoccus lapidicaptus]|uniref:Thymidine kinase n=1 Tax=Tessaracoccus lapidicaptus TaxID=1427523 RepID=A0A1C0AK81_9ACTN|nr:MULTISPECIES: thymidine kinase [Tessaracoccus]AQX14549.1 thymidine kinase [Tessaracoccus sp. T2.5-30]OCL32938.1 thymidine kinase [Tessaracoccus lapidicaptus]VEP38570.1 Thymidine kinase [Tessaracoccus lapidicaptus]
MAELVFHTGPMDCGKSTLALQLDYTQSTHGRRGRVFTSQDRAGEGVIASRLGLTAAAIEVDEAFDFWRYVIAELTGGHRVDYIVCDEAQFYTPDHIDQLARIVDELQLDVYAFGILSDFRTRLFPGSQRLIELADRVETLPIGPLCWCGSRGTHNARTVDGLMVTEGSQVVVGDTTDGGEVRYEVLCRAHHRRRMTATRAKATLSPDPLPFDPDDF